MKRILSFVLAFVMIIGLLPTMSADTALAASGSKFVYDIGNYGKNVESQTFDTTNDTWAYETRKSGSFAFKNNAVTGMQVNVGANGWWAMRVKVTEGGTYDLKMNKATNPYGGITTVYFGKANLGAAAILETEAVGTVDFTNYEITTDTTGSLQEVTVGTVEADTVGEYIIVFYVSQAGNKGGRQYFSNVVLEGKATTEEPVDGAKIIYSMNTEHVASGEWVDTVKLEHTNGFWAYESANKAFSSSAYVRENPNGYGAEAMIGKDAWWAVRIFVPQTGEYALNLNHICYSSGGTANVYFGKASEGCAEILEKTPIGTACFYASAQTAAEIEKVGTVSVDEAGEYILVFKSVTPGDGTNGTRYRQIFKEIILENGENFIPMTAFAKNATVEIEEGATAKIEVGDIYLSDGSKYGGAYSAKAPFSDNTTVATVDANGVITAVSAGETNITLPITAGDFEANAVMKITVVAASPISTATLSYSETELKIGKKATATLELKRENGKEIDIETASIVFGTENSDVISLNETTGEVKAIKEGIATVNVAATLNDKTVYATAKITVLTPLAPSGVRVEYSMEIESVPANALMNDVKFSDTKNSWQYESQNGTITVKRDNTCGALGLPNNRTWWAIRMYVPKAGAYNLKLDRAMGAKGGLVFFYLGKEGEAPSDIITGECFAKETFYAESEVRSSETEALGTVEIDEPGEYIMVMYTPASADFTAEGLSASNRRHFIKKIIFDGGNETIEKMRFTLKPEYDEVYVGGSVETELDELYLSDGSHVSKEGAVISYASFDESKATVDANGVISGIAAGNVKISATVNYKNGETAYAETYVTVIPAPELGEVVASVESSEIEELSDMQISLSGKNADGSDIRFNMTKIAYESNNTEIATVDANGVITAKKAGNATITVTVRQGDSEKNVALDITVINPKNDENPMELSNTFAIYDFRTSAAGGTSIKDLTYADTYNWLFYGYANGMEDNTSTPRTRVYGSYGIQAQPNAIGAVWAIKLTVPKAGRYSATLTYGANSNGGIAELYVLPVTKDTTEWTKDKYSVGTMDFYSTATTYDLNANLSDMEFAEAGEYLLVFECVANGAGAARQQFPKGLTLDGTGGASYIKTLLEKDELEVGESTQLLYRIKLSDGTWLTESENVVFFSSDSNVASVDADGVITAKGEGDAYITLMFKHGGAKKTVNVAVKITDSSKPSKLVLRAPETVYIDGFGNFMQRAVMESFGEISLSAEEISYAIVGGDGEAEITADGKIKGVSAGEVKIVASAVFRGTYIESNEVVVRILEKTQKTEPTLFTYEMRENAKENIAKYDWARAELDLYWNDAENALSHSEEMYNLMLAEGVPRARYCAMNAKDPTYSSCKYCGVDFVQAYGTEYFSVNAITHPWKVQCLSCKRYFPSNDFGSLYELGLNEKGAYDRTKALEENGILCGRGERDENGVYVPFEEYSDNPYGYGDPKGFLYNELYSELHKTGLDPVTGEEITQAWGDFTIDVDGDGNPDPGYFWGVDDGYGYYTGEVLGNGVAVVHPYVANYVYLGATTKAYNTLMDLMYAYMYTDDIRYGRLAAVMLDRMADNLPEMSSGQYPFLVTDGGAGIGKIQGALNDCTILRIYAQACDILYPLIDDPYVIDYLSKKAEKYNLENPKLSGSDIWNNWSDGILREIYRSCLNTKLRGGFGHKHEALSTAAVVLDSMPETEEMLDWLFAPGFEDKTNLYCNGGNTNVELVGTLDRDGFANHGSPNYNSTWIDFLMYVQNALDGYDRYNKYDLFENPKFAKMFTVFTPFTLVSKYTAQIGDSGYTGSQTFECPTMENLVYAYKKLGDVSIARLLYLQNGMKAEGIHDDITVKNPEAIADEIESVIENVGPYLDSEMLTGAGFAVLRDGEVINSVGANATYDSQRDFWMYFGRTDGHGHMGSLNLGIEAFGYNFAPDFGYPEGANNSPKRRWMDGTLAHNTVVVNAKNQLETEYATNPIHFDAGEGAGVIDIDSSDVYAETKVYRRTLVSVKVSDEVSYGVDFFKVLGGSDQIYTFRAHSDEIFETEGLEIVKQVDENGNYVGSYAGADVEYTVDPGYVETGTPKYPIGFPFLKNIRRAENVSGSFAVDFKIKDFQNILPYNMDLHLRMTALNDFATDEVAIASGYVPRRLDAVKYYDTLEQVLIRRKGSGTLDSLFTTVYEPYKDSRYIERIEAIFIEPIEGSISAIDAAKAVKVTHTSGRVDYIAYSTDETRSYKVRDKESNKEFEFTGFVGVLSYMGDELIYSYIHDGERFGTAESDVVRLGGKVSNFEKELSLTNYITITPDVDVNTDELTDKYINIENDGVRNGMYKIISAKKEENGDIRLDIGGVSLIRGYRNNDNPEDGFAYDVAEGQAFTIGLTDEVTNNPEFAKVSEKSISAGSVIKVTVSATSPIGKKISYRAMQLPRGAGFDEETATLTWKPGSSQIGDNRVTILATDEDGREGTLHFVVKVYGSTNGNAGSGTSSGSTGNSAGTSGKQNGNAGDENLDIPKNPDESGTPSNESAKFVDLGNHAWAADSINTLADAGIIKGTSKNTFAPGNNITRADFAILLVRAFEKTSDDAENFDDVLSTDYFAKELAVARNTGMVSGIGDNKFAPRENIKRCDMMLMIYRVLSENGNLTKENYESSVQHEDFDDVPDYAKEAVSALIGAGLVNGKGNKIAPNDNTTRAEVAVLLARVLSTDSVLD